MSKAKQNNIKLHSLFGSIVSTRQAVTEIRINMNEQRSSILDFAQVNFVSRSFAHELLRLIDSSNDSIELINVSPEIQKLVDLVDQARSKDDDEREEDETTESSFALSDPTINF